MLGIKVEFLVKFLVILLICDCCKFIIKVKKNVNIISKFKLSGFEKFIFFLI